MHAGLHLSAGQSRQPGRVEIYRAGILCHGGSAGECVAEAFNALLGNRKSGSQNSVCGKRHARQYHDR
jgi:hypothetical protein